MLHTDLIGETEWRVRGLEAVSGGEIQEHGLETANEWTGVGTGVFQYLYCKVMVKLS